MSLTPIQFHRVENLRAFLDEFKEDSKQQKNRLCRAYQGDIYNTKDVIDHFNTLAADEKKRFNKQNNSLLKPNQLNKQWSLIYLPNFEAFIQQSNSALYPYTQLDLGVLTTDTIKYVKPRFNNNALFNILRSDLNHLETRLKAFTKINQLTAQLFSLNLTKDERRELSQKSPNYLSILYKDFLKITFIQQANLKRQLLNELTKTPKEALKNALQEWIDEIDSNNLLIKNFLENAIKRMQTNQAFKNSVKIKIQGLLGNDRSLKNIQEKIESLKESEKTLRDTVSQQKQQSDWIITSLVWGAHGTFLITALVCAFIVFFVEISLPVVIALGIVYLVSTIVLGFMSPTTTTEYLNQTIASYIEKDLTVSDTLLVDAKFLENYSKLDNDYLDTEENHKPMIDAIVSDLKEMEIADQQYQPTNAKAKASSLGLFKQVQDDEINTDLTAEQQNCLS